MQARSTVGDLTTQIQSTEEADLNRDNKTNFHMTMTNIQKGGSFMNDSSMIETHNKMQTTFPNQMHNQSMDGKEGVKNLSKMEDVLH